MKKFLNILLRVFIVILVLVLLAISSGLAYVWYIRSQKEGSETVVTVSGASGDKEVIISTKIELEPTITCLFLGEREGLTDFIMLGKYDPNTREVNLMSIPRDSKVSGTSDGKINSAYARGLNPMNTVNIVEKLTGVKIDYYILFKTKVLRDIVDAVDGVVVTVPQNMNYDDPYQNLHIHLKKGTYKLNGDQAEQFVRFRRYPNGDVDRVKAQQTFIKAMISRCLEPQNVIKIGDLVKIVLNNTKTNIISDVVGQYIDDAVAFKPDRVRIETLPGEGGYADNGISYFFINEKKAKVLIDELFNQETDMEEVEEVQKEIEEELKSGTLEKELTSGNFEKEPKDIRNVESGDKLRIEVLNNGTSVKNFNRAVDVLNNSGYDVVKVGNLDDKNETKSKIVCYSKSEKMKSQMQIISKIVGIKNTENGSISNSDLDFTIVLGPKYVAE